MFKKILPLFLFLTLLVPVNSVAAYFDLPGPEKPFPSSCNSLLNLYITPENSQVINTAEAIIKYDSSKVDIFDASPNEPGIQLDGGDAFDSYFGSVDTVKGEIKFVGYSLNRFVTEKKVFARIRLRPKVKTVTSSDFSLVFSGAGATYDSNIVESKSSKDLLSKSFNTTIQFEDTSCIVDTTPPSVSFLDPKNFDILTSDLNQIQFQVQDSGSGIDITSLQIDLAGQKYTSTSPEITLEKIDGGYKITIKPLKPISKLLATQIVVRVNDLTGNQNVAVANFNVSKELQDKVCKADPRPGITENVFVSDPRVILDPNNLANSNLPEILKSKGESSLEGGAKVLFSGNLRPQAVDRLMTLANLQWFLAIGILFWLLGFLLAVLSLVVYRIKNEYLTNVDPSTFFNKKIDLFLLVDEKISNYKLISSIKTLSDGLFDFRVPINRSYFLTIEDKFEKDSNGSEKIEMAVGAYARPWMRRVYSVLLNIVPGLLVFGFFITVLAYYFWDNWFLIWLIILYIILFVGLLVRFRKFIWN